LVKFICAGASGAAANELIASRQEGAARRLQGYISGDSHVEK